MIFGHHQDIRTLQKRDAGGVLQLTVTVNSGSSEGHAHKTTHARTVFLRVSHMRIYPSMVDTHAQTHASGRHSVLRPPPRDTPVAGRRADGPGGRASIYSTLCDRLASLVSADQTARAQSNPLNLARANYYRHASDNIGRSQNTRTSIATSLRTRTVEAANDTCPPPPRHAVCLPTAGFIQQAPTTRTPASTLATRCCRCQLFCNAGS